MQSIESNRHTIERHYVPHAFLRHPKTLARDMWQDLSASRELAYRIFLRDVKARYRNSFLGYAWALLPALFVSATFLYLRETGTLDIQPTPVPYALFVFISTLLWQNFAEAMQTPMRSITMNRALLAKVNFPREALIMAGVLEVVFNFCIRLIIILPFLFIYGVFDLWSFLLFPIGLGGLLLLGFAFGIWLTPMGLLFSDLARGIPFLMTFWMFLTPVVYPPPEDGLAALVAKLNPVTSVLSTSRDWLINEPAQLGNEFVVVVLCSVFVALGGWLFYRISLPHVVERMGM